MDKAGYGLIETMRVREERIPFLDRHLARLGRSLGELGLPKPSQDVPALVRPFAATGDAVLRVEGRDGRAASTRAGEAGGAGPFPGAGADRKEPVSHDRGGGPRADRVARGSARARRSAHRRAGSALLA